VEVDPGSADVLVGMTTSTELLHRAVSWLARVNGKATEPTRTSALPDASWLVPRGRLNAGDQAMDATHTTTNRRDLHLGKRRPPLDAGYPSKGTHHSPTDASNLMSDAPSPTTHQASPNVGRQ
jgi:hypothetical protein